MSSIITGIFNLTVSLLWNKARDSTAAKLHGGDITDAKIRDLVVREMIDIKTKLDALSLTDLKSSHAYLQEGVKLLSNALNKSKVEQKALVNETQDENGKRSTITSTTSKTVESDILNEVPNVSHAVRKIKLDSDKLGRGPLGQKVARNAFSWHPSENTWFVVYLKDI